MAPSLMRRVRTGASPDIVLDSPTALADFRATLAISMPLRQGRIIVDPSFIPGSNPAIEERLNELYSDCGCTAGSVAATAATAANAIRLARSAVPVGAAVGLRCLAQVSVAALVGKSIGLMYNRLALLHLTASLEQQPIAVS